MVKVRFAPSPTGIPHIGNTRTALFNFLFAKKNKGKFILRIEDTDKKRFVKEAEKVIYEILEWLDLKWDEKYVQSERIDIYKEHAEILRERGLVYEDDEALRFKMPKNGETTWIDAVGQKEISFKNETQEDFVILKSDGYPTYNFASVVDDYLMEITHVIRGEEFISSTPKHVQLYKAFAWNQPIFAHLPIILGKDKSKLSKREGAKSVLEYREDGYLKEAILNYMALVGWTSTSGQEQMSTDDMIKFFDLKDVNNANPIFDTQKLEWFNGVWIRTLSIDELKKRLLEFDQRISIIPNLEQYIPLAQTRMRTLSDFRNLVVDNKNVTLTEDQRKLANALIDKYRTLTPWSASNISTATISVRDELESSTKDVYTVLTGKPQGLPFDKINEIRTQAGTVSWLKNIIERT